MATGEPTKGSLDPSRPDRSTMPADYTWGWVIAAIIVVALVAWAIFGSGWYSPPAPERAPATAPAVPETEREIEGAAEETAEPAPEAETPEPATP